jgi:prolyl-tRNA synthetase
MNMHKSQRLRDAVEKLHDELEAAGFDVLLDDRKERPGVMFADMELIGIPHRLVVGERGLDAGNIEYKGRQDADKQDISLDSVIDFLKGRQH